MLHIGIWYWIVCEGQTYIVCFTHLCNNDIAQENIEHQSVHAGIYILFFFFLQIYALFKAYLLTDQLFWICVNLYTPIYVSAY